ncbi:hypothetical protein [Thermococcus sp.]|uniref:ArnT family glycosyltransferase n=1 Tax=Thermococcus sp. TaxID=35749 RepID=UPI0026237B88|nr:hypothetical protein [Thermococcus sp.]
MKDRDKIIILWMVAIFLPLFTLRLFQDEMLYMIMSTRAFHLNFAPRSSLVFILTSPFASIGNVDIRVFLLRTSTAFITLLDLILIYRLAKERFDERSAFLGTITFLFSFVALRYGARYTLEPWGVFFVLLALYLLDRKPISSAISLGLAFAARETWLTTYPFFLLYVWKAKRGKTFWRFVTFSTIPVALNFLFIYSISITRSPIGYNARIISNWSTVELLKLDISSWGQFFIAYPLTVLGFIYAVYLLKNREEPLLVALPSVLTLNVVFGFLLNGPFERYTFGPLALMSIYSGYGLVELYKKISNKVIIIRKINLERGVALFLMTQIIVLNLAVLQFSDIGAKGIQDYGYWYDQRVFGILEEYGHQNDSFGGTPHPGMLGFKNWTWADRRIGLVLSKSPDWLITFKSWVKVDRKAVESGAIQIWTFGPYVVIHAREKDAIKRYVFPANFTLWRRP